VVAVLRGDRAVEREERKGGPGASFIGRRRERKGRPRRWRVLAGGGHKWRRRRLCGEEGEERRHG
jgi:hypothetical protein